MPAPISRTAPALARPPPALPSPGPPPALPSPGLPRAHVQRCWRALASRSCTRWSRTSRRPSSPRPRCPSTASRSPTGSCAPGTVRHRCIRACTPRRPDHFSTPRPDHLSPPAPTTSDPPAPTTSDPLAHDAPTSSQRPVPRATPDTVHTQHPLELTDLLNGFDITTNGSYQVRAAQLVLGAPHPGELTRTRHGAR